MIGLGCHDGSTNGVHQEIEAKAGPDIPYELANEPPWFTDVTDAWGLLFHHAAHGAENYFFPAVMSPGAAFLDFDRDGLLDILIVNSAAIPEAGVEAGAEASTAPSSLGNRLFRQASPGRLVDVTHEAGLEVNLYGMGVTVGDVNNDGFPDAYISCYGADRLFVNQQDGTFREITATAGIDNQAWGASAAFFDFDRDGWLDIFVANYVDYDPARPCFSTGGRPDFCNPAMFPRAASRLYRNVTGSQVRSENDVATLQPDTVRFEDVSLASGVARKSGAGLGVVCADFNQDGWQDVYVANDGHANFLWINQQNGTFRDEAVLLGVAYDSVGRGQGSMGAALGDVNHDAMLDLLVTNLEGENNALYLRHREHGFQEASKSAGLGDSFPFTGFGAALFDIEHDGDLDAVVVNGRVRRLASKGPSHAAFWSDYLEHPLVHVNDGLGVLHPRHSMQDDFLASTGAGRALAVGDIDNDGDLDLLVTNSGGSARLYRNDAPAKENWLSVRAVDPRWGGRDAYGAMISLVAADQTWTQAVCPCSSYLTTNDPRVHFGLGAVQHIDRIEILWPDNAREIFAGGDVNAFRVIQFGEGYTP